MDADDTLVGDETPGGRSDGSPARELVRGDAVQRYLVLERLGSGGMGVVYAAYDPELDRRIALKLLHPRRRASAARGAIYRRRLLREAQAIARISHPNVVAIHDVGEHDGCVFLAMEFIVGDTVTDWLRAVAQPLDEILAVFVDAGRGLAAAHAKGLVHRDFKPDNVMLDAEAERVGGRRRARVLDFGLVRTTDDEASAVPSGLDEVLRPIDDALGSEASRDDGIAGTPAYMSPEQLRGLEVDARSDQFSYCVALYEAVYGQRPFDGHDVVTLTVAIAAGRVAEAPSGARVPGELRRLIVRGLSPDPAERWPDMTTLLDALVGLRGRRGRLRVVVPALTGAAAVAIAASWIVVAEPRRRCEREADAAEPWPVARRDEVELAVLADGTSFAREAWERVATRLDERAAALRTGSIAACVATRDDPLAGARHLCFARTRAELIATIDVLATAERDELPAAVRAVDTLPDAGRCADALELDTEIDTPPAELADEVLAARGQLARARADAEVGRFELAQSEAEAVLATARALPYPPLEAEASLALAAIERAEVRFDAAEGHLRAAFEMHASGGDVRGAATAARELASLIGDRDAKPDVGQVWLDVSRALLQRRGARPSEEVAMIGVDAGLRSKRGDFNGARAELERGLALVESAALPDNPVLLLALGGVQRRLGDLDAAEETFERLVAVEHEHLGPGHPDTVGAVVSLASVAYARGELDEAIARYREALELLEAVLGPEHEDVSDVLVNLANAYAVRGELDTALPLYERALAISRHNLGPDHPNVVFTLANIASAHHMRGDAEEALVRYREVTGAIESRLGPEHVELALVLGNMAMVEAGLGQYDVAIAHLLRAIGIFEKSVGPDHIDIAPNLVALGDAYLARGLRHEAMAQFERALAIYEAKKGRDHADVSGALVGIGKAALALGDSARAVAVLERAVEIRERTEVQPIDREAAKSLLALARRQR